MRGAAHILRVPLDSGRKRRNVGLRVTQLDFRVGAYNCHLRLPGGLSGCGEDGGVSRYEFGGCISARGLVRVEGRVDFKPSAWLHGDRLDFQPSARLHEDRLELRRC